MSNGRRATGIGAAPRRVIDSYGVPVPCFWYECDKDGYEEYKAVVTEGYHPVFGARRVNYVFCSHRHLLYWANGHRSLYNLPQGSRTVVG